MIMIDSSNLVHWSVSWNFTCRAFVLEARRSKRDHAPGKNFIHRDWKTFFCFYSQHQIKNSFLCQWLVAIEKIGKSNIRLTNCCQLECFGGCWLNKQYWMNKTSSKMFWVVKFSVPSEEIKVSAKARNKKDFYLYCRSEKSSNDIVSGLSNYSGDHCDQINDVNMRYNQINYHYKYSVEGFFVRINLKLNLRKKEKFESFESI